MNAGEEPGVVAMDVESTHMPTNSEEFVDAPNFDLETYISRYEGFSKIQRLQYIARRCPRLKNDAYRLAIKDLKEGCNTASYKEIMATVGDSLGPGYGYDAAWCEAEDRKAAAARERLELELNQFKTNLIKESIRMGYHELGRHHAARGDLAAAFKCFVRTRDYCTTGRHSAEMCLAVVSAAAGLGNWVHAHNYAAKAEHTAGVANAPEVLAQLRACAGLVHLEAGRYAAAARALACVDPAAFHEGQRAAAAAAFQVLAPEDVAVAGGLCAAAALPRAELKAQVLDRPGFREFLDLVPQVRELLADLHGGRYGAALRRLGEVRGGGGGGGGGGLVVAAELDPYLGPHAAALARMIRENCICQYFSPFLSCSLQSITEAFGMEEAELKEELTKLIVSGRINARIDSKAGTLHLNQSDERTLSYKKALELGAAYRREARGLLLRLSCLQHGFDPARGDEARPGPGGGGGGGRRLLAGGDGGGGRVRAAVAAAAGPEAGGGGAAAGGANAQGGDEGGGGGGDGDEEEEDEDGPEDGGEVDSLDGTPEEEQKMRPKRFSSMD